MALKLKYLVHNLTRNPLRTLLTCAAVALPVMIFVLSYAVIDGVNNFLENSVRQLRLAVTQKASFVNPLPEGHRAKIESLDPTHTRLVSVCNMRWLGGKLKDDPFPLQTMAVDADTFAATFPEYLHDPAELNAWQRDRQAIVIGYRVAERFKWHVGDRITIYPSLPPYGPMEFHVVSTAPNPSDPTGNYCRRDYLEEEIKRAGWTQGLVTFMFIKCASQADLDYFRRAIDQLFANSPDETLTQDEKSFMSQFITQQFNLPRNLAILSSITILVAVLAAANTMSMNFRDRLNEYATMKAIGFKSGLVFAMVQSESLLVCALGGLVAALGPYIAFNHTPLRNLYIPIIQTLDIRPAVCIEAVGISLVIGLLAAVWPSWLAARMRVVEAFRALE